MFNVDVDVKINIDESTFSAHFLRKSYKKISGHRYSQDKLRNLSIFSNCAFNF